MTLRLEVGKTYLARDGGRVAIVGEDVSETYPFWDSDGMTYLASGRYYSEGERLQDLISEVQEDKPTTEYEVGKTYKSVNGDNWEVVSVKDCGDFLACGPSQDTNRPLTLTFNPNGSCCGLPAYDLVYPSKEVPMTGVTETPKTDLEAPDGGPQAYYDYDASWVTHNDFLEAKAAQWGVHSWHLSNISKVLMRWGCKGGTTILYDTKKGLYSFCRVFAVIAGKDALRAYLQSLLDDPQFKAK